MPRINTSVEMESRLMVDRMRRGRGKYEVSLWKDKNILDLVVMIVQLSKYTKNH